MTARMGDGVWKENEAGKGIKSSLDDNISEMKRK